MLVADLLEIIRNGESSGVEFKRDDVRTDKLAKEIVAFANFEGGRVLLGVEKDGTISGLTRSAGEAEEWAMNVCRENVRPSLIPFWETLLVDVVGTQVAVIAIPADAPDKPYEAKQGSAWKKFIRVGTTTREATRDEEARLYQSSGMLRYELRPAVGAMFADLDVRRLENYFREIRNQDEIPVTNDDWTTLLINTELMTEWRDVVAPTIGGILLFGMNPNKFVPQAGVTAVAYAGTEKDYSARERTALRGPIVPLTARDSLAESGLVEQALDFVRRHSRVTGSVAPGGSLSERLDYPTDVVREAVVNAIAHRDYSITVTDIELSLYSDRLEIVSPGRLPNSITVDRMRAGCRGARNELIKETMRDYRLMEYTGLGVPRKILRGMREFNGTESQLVEEENAFRVVLFN